MGKKKTTKKSQPANSPKSKRTYISQTDVPSYTLEQAIRIPRAIIDNYAGEPATPLQVAEALNMTPSSGTFRTLCGASIAFGLTKGGYNADEICVESIATRILTPTLEDDDIAAKREASLRPRVFREFLNKYNGSALPRHDIALNVLAEMGVPREKTESVYDLVLDSAQNVGFIREIKNKRYIDLSGVDTKTQSSQDDTEPTLDDADTEVSTEPSPAIPAKLPQPPTPPSSTNRRVFITHGKNKKFIDPIKKLLGFGEMNPVVSVERQSVSKPVPDKVMEDMRSCGAAIIHVEDEQTLIDKDANEVHIINPNVLIEIGAAMALYGRRYILLVKQGVTLPSNLQGLYEVRYEGDSLDGDATLRLLEAIKDIKNNPLPERYLEVSE